jgi:hypothetical protein
MTAGGIGTAVAEGCATPSEFLETDATLPGFAKRIAARAPIKVVVMGTSYSAYAGNDRDKVSYIGPLQAELARRFPDSAIELVDKSIPRQTAVQMVERLPRDIVPEKPQLVIWQTGTTDAVRNVDPADFKRALVQGQTILRKAGADIVMVNMQYARAPANVIRYERYVEGMETVSDMKGVVLFRRLDIMRHWVASGQFDFDDVAPAERMALIERAQGCVARLLADLIKKTAR